MTSIYLNATKRKLSAGGIASCLGIRQARTVDIALIASTCGFDALYIDMEHSPISIDVASTICIAALGIGITPLVRVPGHDMLTATRALDGGALGIIFPHVNNAAEAKAIADGCRYPPVGHRAVMTGAPTFGYRAVPLGELAVEANAEILLAVMLETPEGVANADSIAAVPGIDLLLIGSNDLCTELGIPGQLRHPLLVAAYESAAKACSAHGKTLGVGGIRSDPELQRRLLKLGARFIIAGSDVSYLMNAARNDIQSLQDLIAAQ